MKTGDSMRKRAKRANRANRRAAAMVEALVVIPVLIILFAGMVYLRRAYAAKMATMSIVRARAWQNAQSANCGSAGDASAGYTAPAASGGTHGGDGSGNNPPSDAIGDTSSSLSQVGLSSDPMDTLGLPNGNEAFDGQTSVAAPPVLGGGSVTAKGHMELLCNEAPTDGSIRNFVDDAKDAISTLWSSVGGFF
jgi:hypothetical protein